MLLATFGFILMPFFKPKTPKRGIKYGEVIESPTYNASIPWGNLVEVKLVKEKVSKYDSVVVEMDNQRIKLDENYSITLNTKELTLGLKVGKVNLWEDGKLTAVDLSVLVISDFMPSVSNIVEVRKITKEVKTYTQGFEFYKDVIYESGGQYGESILRKLNPATGKIIKSINVDKRYFAEGITILNDKIHMLTWKERELLIFDLDLNLIESKPLVTTTGEGWGICNDGKSLIISDGSNKLTYVNPQTFIVEKVIEVYGGHKPANYLNELEFANNRIYANIYTQTQVVVIDPPSGRIINVAELNILRPENKDAEVLNGIAYLPNTKTFMVTGKYWNNMFEVKL
jgi:glutaminyl-peptide cyclotransferase